MAKPDPIPNFIEFSPEKPPKKAPEVSPVESDWVDEFLADRELRPNTKKAYLRQLRQFQSWLEFKHWANVDEKDLSRYKTYLKEKPTRGGKFGLSAASINQALATIQSFFKWLAIRRFINFNPALTLEMVTLAPPKPKDLEVETVQQLADGLSYRGQLSVRDTAILGLLKHGLRATEVSKANIGDFRDQAIRIEDAKWGSDGIVPLAPDTCRDIEVYLGWCVQQGLDTSSGEPLFRSQSNRSKGQRISYRAIYNLVKDLGAIAEIEESVHPHRLRHTFGTQLLLEDVPPEYARKLMRLKSSQTFERYAKRAVEKKAEDVFRKTIKNSTSGLFKQKN